MALVVVEGNVDVKTSLTFNSSLITGSKSPIIIEDSRDIIFFPLKSIRDKCNIWISFNNLEKYVKSGDKTIFYFKGNKQVEIDFSYYIIDNQVTRSLMLDYEVKKRRESLKK